MLQAVYGNTVVDSTPTHIRGVGGLVAKAS